MAKSLARIRREQRRLGLDRDSLPTADPQDPRHRRSAAAAVATERRFNPDQFEVDSDGRVNLNIKARPTTRAVHLDFVGRYDSTHASAPVARITSHISGLLVGVVEVFDLNDQLYMQWPIPADMDPRRAVTVEIGYTDRSGDGSLASWNLDVWAWVGGVSIAEATTAATATLQVVDAATGGADIDVRSTFTVQPGILPVGVRLLKFRLKRVAATSGDPTWLQLHEAVLTYGTRYYHTHER